MIQTTLNDFFGHEEEVGLAHFNASISLVHMVEHLTFLLDVFEHDFGVLVVLMIITFHCHSSKFLLILLIEILFNEL